MNKEILKHILDTRQPVWKRIKMLEPHCPICKQHLTGNNSMMHPYKCECGEWQDDWMNPGHFRIKINPQ